MIQPVAAPSCFYIIFPNGKRLYTEYDRFYLAHTYKIEAFKFRIEFSHVLLNQYANKYLAIILKLGLFLQSDIRASHDFFFKQKPKQNIHIRH